MADHVVQPCHDRDEILQESKQPYQSLWMAHWKNTSFRSGNEAQHQLSICYKSKKETQNSEHHLSPIGSESAMEGYKFAERSTEATKPTMINFMNDSLTESSGKNTSGTFKIQNFPMFKEKKWESALALKTGDDSTNPEEALRSPVGLSSRYDVSLVKSETHLPSVLAGATLEAEFQPGKSFSQPEGSTQILDQQVKSNSAFERNSLSESTPFQDDFFGSNSKIVPYQFNSGKTPLHSVLCEQDAASRPKTTCLSDEKPFNRSIRDPSTSNSKLKDVESKQFEKMTDHSGIEFFPSQISPSEASKLEKLYYGSCALTTTPSSIQDVEPMRICATIDSQEKFSRDPPLFSQTLQHFLTRKKTEVNVSDGGKVFRELKGKTVSELFSLSPNFGFPVKQGLKLQPLDSSTESEEKENVEICEASAVNSKKQESSAETDTMDMDTLKQIFCGVAPSAMEKGIVEGHKSSTSKNAVTSVQKEIKGSLLNADLPDMNKELPSHLAVANSADDRETSSSRTQSLDVDCLLSNAEHPAYLKSGACHDRPFGLDPGCRWVKRLRPSASDSFAYGTKSSKIGEASSHEKVNKLFSRILKGSKTSSEPKMSSNHGKDHMAIDETAPSLRNTGSSSTESVRNNQDVALSHAWIQRWCHKSAGSHKKNSKAIVLCEPECSKEILDDFQKKQFPSIHAMALMGKAMTSFRPCAFTKRGSFVVWN